MRNLLLCVLLAGITLATYWQVNSFDFINYDDQGYVYENPHILRGLNWETLNYAFRSMEQANYHPATWISLALHVSLFGNRPGPFHLENVCLHALNSAFLFLFLARSTQRTKPAFFAAALFAVHPLHVESVAWIAERKDVLSGLFFFLGLLAYLRYVRAAHRGKLRWYGLTLVLMILGLLAKPTVVTFPLVLLLFDFWPLRRTAGHGNDRPTRWTSLLLEKIPMLVCAAGASAATYVAQHSGGAVMDLAELSLRQRVANISLAYVRYIGKFFWPSHLSIFYPLDKNVPVVQVLLCLVFLGLITWLCFLYRERAPFLIVGWLYFLGTLVPAIGLVQVGWQSIADRYMYLPMLGPIIMVTWGVGDLLGRLVITRRAQPIGGFGAAAVLAAAAMLTINQLKYWHDTRRLFEHALAVTDRNTVAHVQLGYLDAELGNFNAAKMHYQEAIRIDPTYFVTEFDLANLLLRNHQPELALPHYQRAAANRPGVASIENNWGVTLLQLDRPREAFDHFQRAEQLDPEMADPHINLARLYVTAGRYAQAAAEFQLAPDDPRAREGLHQLDAIRAGANKK